MKTQMRLTNQTKVSFVTWRGLFSECYGIFGASGLFQKPQLAGRNELFPRDFHYKEESLRIDWSCLRFLIVGEILFMTGLVP